MRLVFLILLLANVGFFAYTQLARQQAGIEAQIPLLQISPDKIRMLKGSSGPAAAPKPAPPGAPSAEPVAQACLEWGVFAGPDVPRAETAMAQLALPEALVQRTVADAGGYWVFIPPLKTKSEIDKKIGELKSFGVTEFFVVQEANQWRNAISLGIFRSEDASQAFLAGLRKRGVRSAVSERRENFLKQMVYYVRDPGDAMAGRLAVLQREFPGSEIRAVPCPGISVKPLF
jgi:hypothetical protein